MIDFYLNLHPVVQGLLKGLAVILVIFPIGGACSMAERKVSAWIQADTLRSAIEQAPPIGKMTKITASPFRTPCTTG